MMVLEMKARSGDWFSRIGKVGKPALPDLPLVSGDEQGIFYEENMFNDHFLSVHFRH